MGGDSSLGRETHTRSMHLGYHCASDLCTPHRGCLHLLDVVQSFGKTQSLLCYLNKTTQQGMPPHLGQTHTHTHAHTREKVRVIKW